MKWISPSLPGQDALDLLQVVDIVSGEHQNDTLNRFLTTLGVHAKMFPLLWRERFEHGEVRFAQRAKKLQGFAGIAFLVVAADNPRILIEGGDRCSGRAEN